MSQSLEDDLAVAAKAGFDGVELWWEKVVAYLATHSPAELKALLEGLGLVPVALCPLMIWPFRDSEPARRSFRAAVDLAPAIGCDLVIACPDFRPARLSREAALDMHAAELAEMATYAAARSVRLAIEPIGRHTLCAGPADALELIRRAGSPGNVGVVLDTFHYFRSQVTAAEIDALPLEKLFIVHVNDTEDGAIDELKDSNRVYPLAGVIPLVELLEGIVARGYQGYLSVEMFRPQYWAEPGAVVARRSRETLGALMERLAA